jgi:gluconolactonase
MTVEVFDDRVLEIVAGDARVEQVATGCEWTEGPVWLPEGAVLFSDIPNNRICRWSEDNGLTVFRDNAEFTNGHMLDLDGRLVSCSHGHRRIERTEPDGTVTSLVTHYQGRRLNSPNDLVIKSDGTIWFTDPPYGIASDREGHAAESEIGCNYVFRLEPDTGALTAVTDTVDEPNGLAFSPDESILYVADTSAALRQDGGGNHHIMAFDVVANRALDNPRVFAVVEPGLADGFRVMADGTVLTSAGDGVHVLAPSGELLGKIRVPEVVSNCCLGGPDGHTLFITASTSLYRIELLALANPLR